jgi:hypothetical protein
MRRRGLRICHPRITQITYNSLFCVNIQVTAAGAGSSGVRKDLGELF